jgi:hypothetical protein
MRGFNCALAQENACGSSIRTAFWVWHRGFSDSTRPLPRRPLLAVDQFRPPFALTI